jgi:hypothetical protein
MATATIDNTPASIVIATPVEKLADATVDRDLQLASCPALESIVVRTRSSVYELIVLSGDRGEVMIRGGRFFPEFRRATVAGSSFGGSCMKLRSICVGLYLELHTAGRLFVTSRIQAVSRGSRAEFSANSPEW